MMEFKKSPVVFDEESHTYTLGGRKLLGITGLIHSILGLGVYPEVGDYVKDFIIPRAGSRGTAVHHAIQTYDMLGVKQTRQIVHTRYGCMERDNIYYKHEEWDVTDELESYIRHMHENGFRPLFNELTVSDNLKYASQIDNGWLSEKTGGIWLVDTKSNNIDLYPLCGYFIPDYFTSGEEALKEYLSWQLSVYAVLFEAENPGMKVEGLACNWLRKSEEAFWIIERKPDGLVLELLRSDYIFSDNGPFFFHPDPSVFGIGKRMPAKKEEKVPVLPEKMIGYIAGLLKAKNDIEEKLGAAKDGLRKAMETHGIKSYDSGLFKATIAKDSVKSTFDARKFKADHPDLYEEYTVQKEQKGSFTLK